MLRKKTAVDDVINFLDKHGNTIGITIGLLFLRKPISAITMGTILWKLDNIEYMLEEHVNKIW